MKKLIALTAVLLLSACSLFGSNDKEIIFDTALGPNTKGLVADLPSTLKGDADHARYSSLDKKGKGMESEDGTGQD